jgi:hypothetical protein
MIVGGNKFAIKVERISFHINRTFRFKYWSNALLTGVFISCLPRAYNIPVF